MAPTRRHVLGPPGGHGHTRAHTGTHARTRATGEEGTACLTTECLSWGTNLTPRPVATWSSGHFSCSASSGTSREPDSGQGRRGPRLTEFAI